MAGPSIFRTGGGGGEDDDIWNYIHGLGEEDDDEDTSCKDTSCSEEDIDSHVARIEELERRQAELELNNDQSSMARSSSYREGAGKGRSKGAKGKGGKAGKNTKNDNSQRGNFAARNRSGGKGASKGKWSGGRGGGKARGKGKTPGEQRRTWRPVQRD